MDEGDGRCWKRFAEAAVIACTRFACEDRQQHRDFGLRTAEHLQDDASRRETSGEDSVLLLLLLLRRLLLMLLFVVVVVVCVSLALSLATPVYLL